MTLNQTQREELETIIWRSINSILDQAYEIAMEDAQGYCDEQGLDIDEVFQKVEIGGLTIY